MTRTFDFLPCEGWAPDSGASAKPTMTYQLYILDTETTGLDPQKHEVIELSIRCHTTKEQRTWFLKPLSPETIDEDALRINEHKKEDLLHKTAAGKEKYKLPGPTLVEIENWLLEDGETTEFRVMAGHNVMFDKLMLESLWKKQNSSDSFPFGRRYLDTMQLQFAMDYANQNMQAGYSLSNLVKRYSLKNEKAHTAEADTKVTHEVLDQLFGCLKGTSK